MMSEEQVCDAVIKWFEEYKAAMGLDLNVVPMVFINRRWGKQLRAFAPTMRETLERDGRFAFSMNKKGGMDVAVKLGVSKKDALAFRALLYGGLADGLDAVE